MNILVNKLEEIMENNDIQYQYEKVILLLNETIRCIARTTLKKYKYNLDLYEFDDLVQEGRLGLMMAIDRWHRGFRTIKENIYHYFVTAIHRHIFNLIVRLLFGKGKINIHKISIQLLNDKGCNIADLNIDIEHSIMFKNVIESLLNMSDEKECKIIVGILDGKTYDEIGKDLGISKQRIRQILQSNIRRHFTCILSRCDENIELAKNST